MRYRRLGRTALQVSELCLGTMNFGPQTPEDESFAIMDRALELGINFFDTANRYGGDKGAGATESIIGRWFAQGGGRREKVVLATKLFGAMSEWPNDGRLSARHIRMACDDSLRRMQTDHIDLYQMHHIDRTAPWEEVWQAMDTLIAAGQDHVRRQQQLRRLAHRPGQRGGRPRAHARPRQRAEPLQPARAHRRARGAPGVSRVRRRHDPVEPAVQRAARRCPRRRRRIPAPVVAVTAADRQAAPPAGAVGEAVRRPRGGAGRRRARRGCWPRTASHVRSSARGRWPSSTAPRCAPSTSRWRRTR